MKKKFLAAVLAGMMVMSMAACGGKATETTKAEETTKTAETTKVAESTKADASKDTGSGDLSGSISMSGSTSMEKLVTALSQDYMEKNKNVTVNAEFVGSGAGIEAVTAGTVDIGNASRALKDEEKANGIVENIGAIDGIAVVTDPANKVEDLTKDQLTKIYTGEITNWSDLGGADEQIVVIGREAGSGTRDAFEEINDVKDACKYAQELDSTGAVLAKVAATPGAIGYVSLDVVDDTVQAVKLDGADASEESILAGKYLLSRPFVMATMGEISEQNDLVKTWFDYIGSEEGQAVIKGLGLILPQ